MGVKIKLNDIDPNNGLQKLLMQQNPELYENTQVEEKEASKHKYNAKKVEYDGIVFDSKRECYMYQLLKKVQWKHEITVHRQLELPIFDSYSIEDSYWDPDTNETRSRRVRYRQSKVVLDFALGFDYRTLSEEDQENTPNWIKTFTFIHKRPFLLLAIDTKGYQTEKSKLQMKMLRAKLECPLLLPNTNKHCDQIFQMLSEGIFANIKFEKPKSKKGVKK